MKGAVGIRVGELENFSKINKRGEGDYSVLESVSFALLHLMSNHISLKKKPNCSHIHLFRFDFKRQEGDFSLLAFKRLLILIFISFYIIYPGLRRQSNLRRLLFRGPCLKSKKKENYIYCL